MRVVVRWVSSHRAIADRVLVRELLGERQGSGGRITGPFCCEETTEPLDYLGSGVFRLSEKCSLFHETSLWEQESGR